MIEERITNERIRKIFFNVPAAENTIVIMQMNYLGKIIRGPANHPPRQHQKEHHAPYYLQMVLYGAYLLLNGTKCPITASKYLLSPAYFC